jgi:hypothetical protein
LIFFDLCAGKTVGRREFHCRSQGIFVGARGNFRGEAKNHSAHGGFSISAIHPQKIGKPTSASGG